MSYDIDYLTLLSQQYPTVKAASTEIIRLQSRQKLPKLTEHFMSDIHGEYESFLHILKNASGVIKDKITQIYGRTLSERDRQVLATLIYYPEQKLEYIKDEVDDINDWYKITLYRLIEICRVVASKYTRAKIREFLPEAFGSTIDELIHANTDYGSDKESYYNESISTIVELGQADDFIVEISTLIQTLAIGRLHIIGDIFDRGPRADIILDTLTKYHSVDIQWGNHDVQWMGAAAGSLACIANVLAISTKYSNFDCLEDGYGINMRPLTVFALETYADDPCECFIPRNPNMVYISQHDENFWAKVHKAISVIQFKLEGQIIKRHPEFNMDNHLMLDKINYENGTIMLEGKEYKLKDTNFPTINPENPFELTDAEKELKDKNLVASVKEKLITADDKYYPVGYVVKQEPDTGSAQIPEGSTVTIYVSSGVSLDVTVDLPSDCQASNYYVSLWENNANMTAESKKLNTSGLREYTFQGISSKQESVTYTVKISTDQKDYYRVAQITVNFKTGRVTVGREYTDYKALNDKDTSSDSSGSSGTTGGNNTNKSNTNNR